MKNTMENKGYVGSVEFSQEDELFYGKALGVRDLISYEGASAKELLTDFRSAIDDYLELCSAKGIKPEAALCALSENMSLNNLVEAAISSYLQAH